MATSTLDTTRAGTHSCVIEPRLKQRLSAGATDKYGRMFPPLPTPEADEAALIALGRSGAVMDDSTGFDDEGNNPNIPAGFTIFGQFIAHDITADRSMLQHHENVDQLHNQRTPRLDLESVYGRGPLGSAYFYDLGDEDKLLLGINDAGLPNDLPRNRQGRALIGDPRDDVHSLISQLHVAFLTFHNRIVDHLRESGTPGAEVFGEAQRLARWHHQWIVTHEFLPLTAGAEIVQDVLTNGPRYYSYAERPFIPIEFADAAYRYGHSQIRSVYHLNENMQGRVFPECAGGCPVSQSRTIDWRYFFNLGGPVSAQHTRRIDTRLVHPLISLPMSVVGQTDIPEYHSLAVRDLLRGRALDLPSGEALARYMGIEPLSAQERGLDGQDWQGETPLWFYILRESQVRQNGARLGEVGGRIVAEVLIGLIDADPLSYRSVDPGWRPTLPSAEDGSFTMADLLRFAGVRGTQQESQ
ncbi:MAG TPA: heme peroxidase family protein [Chloroflexota bacterium]